MTTRVWWTWGWSGFKLNPVEVHRETKSMIFFTTPDGREDRALKVTRSRRYFETMEEAIDWRRERLRLSVENAENQLHQKRDKYNRFLEEYGS